MMINLCNIIQSILRYLEISTVYFLSRYFQLFCKIITSIKFQTNLTYSYFLLSILSPKLKPKLAWKVVYSTCVFVVVVVVVVVV